MKRICICLIALAASPPVHAGDDAVKQSIALVRKLQTDGGGFVAQAPVPNQPGTPSLRATSAAVRALHYLGGEIKDKEACIKFVAGCFNPDSGGFSDTPKGQPGVFETAVGLMAVAELKMPIEKFEGGVKYLTANAKTFEEIRIAAAAFEAIKKQSTKREKWLGDVYLYAGEEGHANPRDAASILVTMMRLGAKPSDPAATLKTLNDGQRKSGGWGRGDDPMASDLETSYRVMRCYMMLKAQPKNADGVRAFVAKCRNADGGFGVMPGQPSTVNATYFASIITHWLNEKR